MKPKSNPTTVNQPAQTNQQHKTKVNPQMNAYFAIILFSKQIVPKMKIKAKSPFSRFNLNSKNKYDAAYKNNTSDYYPQQTTM